MIASLPRTEMLRLSLSLVLAVVLAVAGGALAGCGSSSIPIDDLVPELQQRACARAVACGGAESQTSCESTIFLAQDSGVLTVVQDVKRGTIKYDGASARVCVDAITTDCADLVEPAACNNIFRGTVPAGGACVVDTECVDRAPCLKPDTCTTTCCAGTCQAAVAPVAIGGACDFTLPTPCVAGAFCANDGTCTARRAAGAACQGARDECLDPAVCLSLPGGSETCTVISTQPGAACVPGANFGCARQDEICNATTSLCTKRGLPGAACTTYGDCVGYAYCDTAAGTCTLSPTVGQACDVNNGVFCLGGLSCQNGVCSEPTVGMACVP